MLKFNSRDERYKTPFGAVPTGQEVKITFPVGLDILAEGVFLVVRKDGESDAFDVRKPLDLTCESQGYAIYQCSITYHSAGIYFYRFEIATKGGFIFVGRDDFGSAEYGDFLPEWQQTVFFPDFKGAENLFGGVIYHIFPDRFNRILDSQKPKYGYLKEWKQDISIGDSDGIYRANDFYGGNIKGIISKLDYLQELGVTAIYLSPIFESSSNHRYDTANYMNIDLLFGTEEEFVKLCSLAKSKGMSVILDGVFNHTGADSIYFNKFGHYDNLGAYQSKESPYYDWYTFTNFPDEYDCWWGITVVPTISSRAKGFQNMIAGDGGVLEKWTSLGASAWRLDVADELSTPFLEAIRKKLKSMGNIAIIGEVWEDASTKVSYGEKRQYLFGDELDGVMNYPFRNAIIDYVKSGDAFDFVKATNDIMENYPSFVLDGSMTLLGTHDTVRIINALGVDSVPQSKEERRNYKLSAEEREKGKKLIKLASAIQYALPGIPNIYYGDEIGMEGFEDPINRRPMSWDNVDDDLLAHYKMLGMLRKRRKADFQGRAKVYTTDGANVIIERKGIKFTIDAIKNNFEVEEK